ncbi:hypothetical protein GGS23DRAFT_523660 [Durotheca rogersii]|uniref:uncharacterized protein n=1 Tax=Durotheca rogersii TaxID=419775 RepID=UPI00221FFDED|nr:uncharacterized protein GGS23DRAFT_523660 [Durotheca rogersii]KAI5863982.1 hypothetical protein GGS23DRAFT_523660 [Durotheca rogersii]
MILRNADTEGARLLSQSLLGNALINERQGRRVLAGVANCSPEFGAGREPKSSGEETEGTLGRWRVRLLTRLGSRMADILNVGSLSLARAVSRCLLPICAQVFVVALVSLIPAARLSGSAVTRSVGSSWTVYIISQPPQVLSGNSWRGCKQVLGLAGALRHRWGCCRPAKQRGERSQQGQVDVIAPTVALQAAVEGRGGGGYGYGSSSCCQRREHWESRGGGYRWLRRWWWWQQLLW